MKIAVIHFGKRGAGPTFALEMAKALSKQNHEIFYYASNMVENRNYVEKESLQTRFFKTYNSKLTYLKSILFRKELTKVIASLNQDNPDVIYSPMNDLWIPFIFPKLKHIIRIKTIHDVGVHEGNNSFFNKWWNRTNFKDADKYIILSRKYVPQLIERGISKDKVCVIPHAGFDYYEKIGISKNKNFKSDLLFFGRIDKYKGLNVLLDAMRIVVRQYPHIILNIVGNGDLSPYQDKLDELEQNVRVINRWIKDEEVASFVSQTNIVVLPYTHATQSGVIPLAYAFSKPVVATNVGCLDEQIINGLTGYLVSSIKPEAFAEALINILHDKEKIKSMGENANKFMQENLTWTSSATQLVNFILKK